MLQGPEASNNIREVARAFEEALPAEQRKQLGQFFTGLRLGKVLAHLALQSDTRTILDPMAGHGDLLDATWEAAGEQGITLERGDGVEVERTTAAMCRDRLSAIGGEHGTARQKIVTGSAFGPELLKELPESRYDLVITNPPFVRYQAQNENGTQAEAIRSGLIAIADSQLSGVEAEIWKTLIEGYSGLADLSVPAWLLAGLMVRPGGRLALVVPATWRSRDYADVIRYLLLRCFSLEVVVEDTQPGWFSDALVRTHLIVAKRLYPEEVHEPLCGRDRWPRAQWLRVSPEAADDRSLVGAAFKEHHPEAAFSSWLRSNHTTAVRGIETRDFDLRQEWGALQSRIRRRRWYRSLENSGGELTLGGSRSSAIPDVLRSILPVSPEARSLISLEEAGIQVGQGLRTGCNRFFYVTACGSSEGEVARVSTSPTFGSYEFSVPSDVLRLVLRRQSEVKYLERDEIPPGRVLNLRGWVLPEDAKFVADAITAYAAKGETLPEVMPDELAAFVRHAATAPLESSGKGRKVPDLSAVRTNVRKARAGIATPRFWYMLPDFAPRHLPAAFVARINHRKPWVQSNFGSPLLIDANFSTFWALSGAWTRFSIKALLNSAWCRAFMEALGTPLGGGALKLEATHLRQILVPRLTKELKVELEAAGKKLTRDAQYAQAQIDTIVLRAILPNSVSGNAMPELASIITEQANMMRRLRQKVAP